VCIEHIRLRPGESDAISCVETSIRRDGFPAYTRYSDIIGTWILSEREWCEKEKLHRAFGNARKKRKPWRFPDFPYASLFFILRLEKGKNAVYG